MAVPFVLFRDLGKISQGVPIRRYTSNKGTTYRVVNVGDLEHLQLGEVHNQAQLAVPDVQRYKLQQNDVVIAIRGTLLKSSVVKGLEQESVSNQTTAFFRPNLSTVDPLYIAVLLRSDYFWRLLSLEQRQATTSLPSFRVSELRDLKIPLPVLAVQQQIAQLFLTMEQMEKVAQETIKTRQNLTKLALFKVIEG